MEKKYTLSLDIYDKSTIEQGISDFSDIAEISFLWGQLVFVWENDEEIDESFHEFMNYVLSI